MKKFTLLILLFCSIQIFSVVTLNIDGVIYTVDTLANYNVGPGTKYTSLRLQAAKRLDVYFLKTDLTNPYVSFKAVLGRDSIYTGEQPSAMAKRKSKDGAVYFAGTNGDFYNTSGYIGMPIGCTMIDGQIATPPNSWKTIAFDEQQVPSIGVLSSSVSIKKGSDTWTVNRINHLRGTDQLVLFNQHNGKGTRTNSSGTEVLLQLQTGEKWSVNKQIKANVTKIEIGKGNMAIPAGYAVLSGNGTAQTLLNSLAINDEVTIQINMLQDGVASSFSNIVGGESRAPMLKNGIIEQTDIWNELHPRTGAGYSQDKKIVIFCVADGRGASAGVTTKQLAQLMQSAGAYTAFNMDGGGSSCMYVKEFGPMNATSDGTERAVANGIFAVSSAPTDNNIASIKSYNSTIRLPHFGVIMPKFLAYNQYGVLINKDLKNVILSCDKETGEIAQDGRFVASGTQGGIVTARYNNIETTFQVELVSSAQIAFRLDSVLIDSKRNYAVQIQSVIGLNTMDVLPEALNWSVSEPAVCSVENGIIRGIKNGSTTITGMLGSFKDSLKVKVEIPENQVIIAEKFNKNWILEASSSLNANLTDQDLPTGWSHGVSVNYTFNSTRAPYIKLTGNKALYGLPDTLKMIINPGDISIARLLVSLKSNISNEITKEITNFQPNQDNILSIPLISLFDTNDIAVFPLKLNSLTFYLNTQTPAQQYRLAFKELQLSYKNYQVSGLTTPDSQSLSVYPNPVNKNYICIQPDDACSGPITILIYCTNGQLVYSKTINYSCKKELRIGVSTLTQGTYIMKARYNDKEFTSIFQKI